MVTFNFREKGVTEKRGKTEVKWGQTMRVQKNIAQTKWEKRKGKTFVKKNFTTDHSCDFVQGEQFGQAGPTCFGAQGPHYSAPSHPGETRKAGQFKGIFDCGEVFGKLRHLPCFCYFVLR